ncbi:hypothetical protein Pelo_9249 [Pelomyxa schiedti]|nr:hypothetical protein Pelo_9249 [Pelomyxa schiedti]
MRSALGEVVPVGEARCDFFPTEETHVGGGGSTVAVSLSHQVVCCATSRGLELRGAGDLSLHMVRGPPCTRVCTSHDGTFVAVVSHPHRELHVFALGFHVATATAYVKEIGVSKQGHVDTVRKRWLNVEDMSWSPVNNFLLVCTEQGSFVVRFHGVAEYSLEVSEVPESPDSPYTCGAWHPSGAHIALVTKQGNVQLVLVSDMDLISLLHTSCLSTTFVFWPFPALMVLGAPTRNDTPAQLRFFEISTINLRSMEHKLIKAMPFKVPVSAKLHGVCLVPWDLMIFMVPCSPDLKVVDKSLTESTFSVNSRPTGLTYFHKGNDTHLYIALNHTLTKNKLSSLKVPSPLPSTPIRCAPSGTRLKTPSSSSPNFTPRKRVQSALPIATPIKVPTPTPIKSQSTTSSLQSKIVFGQSLLQLKRRVRSGIHCPDTFSTSLNNMQHTIQETCAETTVLGSRILTMHDHISFLHGQTSVMKYHLKIISCKPPNYILLKWRYDWCSDILNAVNGKVLQLESFLRLISCLCSETPYSLNLFTANAVRKVHALVSSIGLLHQPATHTATPIKKPTYDKKYWTPQPVEEGYYSPVYTPPPTTPITSLHEASCLIDKYINDISQRLHNPNFHYPPLHPISPSKDSTLSTPTTTSKTDQSPLPPTVPSPLPSNTSATPQISAPPKLPSYQISCIEKHCGAQRTDDLHPAPTQPEQTAPAAPKIQTPPVPPTSPCESVPFLPKQNQTVTTKETEQLPVLKEPVPPTALPTGISNSALNSESSTSTRLPINKSTTPSMNIPPTNLSPPQISGFTVPQTPKQTVIQQSNSIFTLPSTEISVPREPTLQRPLSPPPDVSSDSELDPPVITNNSDSSSDNELEKHQHKVSREPEFPRDESSSGNEDRHDSEAKSSEDSEDSEATEGQASEASTEEQDSDDFKEKKPSSDTVHPKHKKKIQRAPVRKGRMSSKLKSHKPIMKLRHKPKLITETATEERKHKNIQPTFTTTEISSTTPTSTTTEAPKVTQPSLASSVVPSTVKTPTPSISTPPVEPLTPPSPITPSLFKTENNQPPSSLSPLPSTPMPIAPLQQRLQSTVATPIFSGKPSDVPERPASPTPPSSLPVISTGFPPSNTQPVQSPASAPPLASIIPQFGFVSLIPSGGSSSTPQGTAPSSQRGATEQPAISPSPTPPGTISIQPLFGQISQPTTTSTTTSFTPTSPFSVAPSTPTPFNAAPLTNSIFTRTPTSPGFTPPSAPTPPPTTPQGSVFAKAPTASIFGANTTPPTSFLGSAITGTNLFGATSTSSPSGTNLFGGAQPPSSPFNPTATASLFPSTQVFGNPSSSPSQQQPHPQPPNTGSVFGSKSTQPSFGSTSALGSGSAVAFGSTSQLGNSIPTFGSTSQLGTGMPTFGSASNLGAAAFGGASPSTTSWPFGSH